MVGYKYSNMVISNGRRFINTQIWSFPMVGYKYSNMVISNGRRFINTQIWSFPMVGGLQILKYGHFQW